MNEEEIINYLRSLRDAIVEGAETIKNLEKKVDEYISANDEKVNELKSTLYEQVIDPANEYIAEMDRNDRFNQFNERHGEKLSPFNEELSALEGDDFDIVRTAFDAYDNYEGDDIMDEDEYVDQLVEQVEQKLSDIKEKLGIPADTDVAVQETEDGGVEVVTEDGEVVASTDDEEESLEEKYGDEVTEDGEDEDEEEEEVKIDDASEVEDDPEEVAAFEEELKNQK